MKPDPQKRLILILSGLFDMLLGAYLALAGIGWLPSLFGETPWLKWVGVVIFLAGTGVVAFFATRQGDA